MADLPRFFIVDDIPVKVDLSPDGKIRAFTAAGVPFPVAEAILEGEEVTLSDFNTAASRLAASL